MASSTLSQICEYDSGIVMIFEFGSAWKLRNVEFILFLQVNMTYQMGAMLSTKGRRMGSLECIETY